MSVLTNITNMSRLYKANVSLFQRPYSVVCMFVPQEVAENNYIYNLIDNPSRKLALFYRYNLNLTVSYGNTEVNSGILATVGLVHLVAVGVPQTGNAVVKFYRENTNTPTPPQTYYPNINIPSTTGNVWIGSGSNSGWSSTYIHLFLYYNVFLSEKDFDWIWYSRGRNFVLSGIIYYYECMSYMGQNIGVDVKVLNKFYTSANNIDGINSPTFQYHKTSLLRRDA